MVYVRACVCVRACVHDCWRACVRVRVCMQMTIIPAACHAVATSATINIGSPLSTLSPYLVNTIPYLVNSVTLSYVIIYDV